MNPKKTEQDSGLSSRASSAKTATPDPHQNRHGLARSAGCWSEQEVKPGDRGTFHGTCPRTLPYLPCGVGGARKREGAMSQNLAPACAVPFHPGHP